MGRIFGFLVVLACGMVFQFGPANAGMIIGNGNINDPAMGANGLSFGAHEGYGKQFNVSANATARGASILLGTRANSTVPTSSTFNIVIYDLGSFDGAPPTNPIGSAQVVASFSSTNQGQWLHVEFNSGINLLTTSFYVFAVERVTGPNANISWSQPANSVAYSGGTVNSGYWSKLDGQSYALITDPLSFGFQLTTEAVPEPSSAAVAMLLIGGGLVRRFRRTFA